MKQIVFMLLAMATTLCISIPAMANSTSTSMSTGLNHAGFVLEDGSLIMWGQNEYGDFGDGTTELNYHTFRQTATDVVAVACGYYNSTAILKKDNTMWVTGRNNANQLGTGDNKNSSVFIQLDTNVVKIAAGEDCFIYLKKDGTLWGVGETMDRRLLTTQGTNLNKPEKIMDDVADFSTGVRHTGIIKKDGTLYMFGSNAHGQLGQGNNNSNDSITMPVKVMENVRSVSCGTDYTLAVKNDNTLYGWGYNGYGEIMDASNNAVYSPKKVADNVLKACAGKNNSAYITTSNDLYMCGYNLYAELGFDHTDLVSTPTLIASNVKDVAVSNRTIYTTLDGKMFTAGNNINEIGFLYKGFKEQPYKIAEAYAFTLTETVDKGEPNKSENPATEEKPATVTIKSAKNVKNKSVKLIWNKADKAKKYQIQYSLNKKFKTSKKYKTKTKTTKKTSVTIKKLTKKKTYYFRVRVANGKTYGKWSKVTVVKINK